MKPEPHIPDNLAGQLEETVCAAILAERGTEALDDAPRRRAPRWTWAAIPVLAAACLAVTLLVSRPAPLPPETAAAYAHFEEAFSCFAEALQSGQDVFSSPYTPTVTPIR